MREVEVLVVEKSAAKSYPGVCCFDLGVFDGHKCMDFLLAIRSREDAKIAKRDRLCL